MNTSRVESYADQVEQQLPRYLSADKTHVSASKISGLLGLSNMAAYAVKAKVEDSLSRIIPEIEKDEHGGVAFKDWEEYHTWLYAEVARERAEAEKLKAQTVQDP